MPSIHSYALRLALCAGALTPAALPAGADVARLACTADTNISSHPTEVDFNWGQGPRIRVKGHEMLMLARFDLDPVRGWRVRRAVLHLHTAGEHRLRVIGASTVAVEWEEGSGTGGTATDGATFRWAAHGRTPWGGRQSDFTDAALTARGTLTCANDVAERADGWLEVDIAPDLVHAMLNGHSDGLAIIDEKGQTHWNNDVHSREQSGFAPYMTVEGEPTGTPATTAPKPAHAPPAVKLPPPLAPVRPPTGRAAPPRAQGGVRVWAYGECEKAHPVSGNLLEEVGDERYPGPAAGSYRSMNPVWDGATSTVRLAAARNEFVAFHLCIESATGKPLSGTVRPGPLTGPGGARIAAGSAQPLTVWYVRDGEWYGEVARPMGGRFAIPDEANRVPGQRNQSVLVDLFVPHATPPGRYTGVVTVDCGTRGTVRVPVALTVWPFTLPDTLSFELDLNAYGPPGDAAAERAFHRAAHAHRATLNILGYSQNGTADAAYVPRIEGTGADARVTDWSEFDRRFGPYFDGSAFADMPRKGVPLSHAYLPFSEGWPSHIRGHYRYTQTVTAYPDLVVEHAMKAPPIGEAFDPAFAQAMTALVSQFAAHFADKRWTRTEFQYYLNNKYFFKDPAQGGRGSSWWLLDEPMHRDDWLALRWFGRLFRAGLAGRTGVRFVYRGDISRPQWQRDWLDGIADLLCVSGELFSKNERCMQMQREQGFRFWHYGTGNDIRVTNLTAEAWALKAYLAGADGMLPWNSLGGDGSFDAPTPTTLLYPGGRFGTNEPLVSMRLKAMRRGQQDVEYLALLAKRRGWDRAQLAAALGGLLDLRGRTAQSFVDDAGRTLFDNLAPEDFASVRATVAAALGGGRAK